MAYILQVGSKRIEGAYRFLKNNARTYVSGPTTTKGYGLANTLTDHKLYEAANALALNEAFLYASPDDVMFSHESLWHFTERALFTPVKASVHPDNVSGQILGVALNNPAFMRGAVMPIMAIVTVGSVVIIFYSLGDENCSSYL